MNLGLSRLLKHRKVMFTLQEHIDFCRKQYSGKRGFGSIRMDIKDFSCLDQDLVNSPMSHARLPSVEYYPPCTKYTYPESITFKNPGKLTKEENRISVEVNLNELISLDHEHFLELHAPRYDVIKREISEGHVFMPFVDIGFETPHPRVTGGRHRIIALKTIGLTHIPISVDQSKLDKIKGFLNLGSVKAKYTIGNLVFCTGE